MPISELMLDYKMTRRPTRLELRFALPLLALLFFHFSPQTIVAQEDDQKRRSLERDPLSGPDEAQSLIKDYNDKKASILNKNFEERWQMWKSGIAEKSGFSFGFDYTSVGQTATESLGDKLAASGIARFYGSWDLVNRGSQNTGSVVFKVEHRHKYTDMPPQFFGAELGYVGTPEPVFNNDGFRGTELFWKQNFLKDKAVARVGFVDMKQYFNVYALASPWTGFHNLAFSTGSNTQIILPDAALGAMVGGYIAEHIYIVAGITDAIADPTNMFEGFDTFFSDFDTFKSFEIGLTEGGKLLFLDNAHIAIWQLDDSDVTGLQGGWGINASFSKRVGQKWLPFIRAAWADEGSGLYELSLSTGAGFMSKPGGNLLGFGLNWGRPNSNTIPLDLNDQWTGEIFYRLQFTEHTQLTPSIQFLGNPALNPDTNFIAIFGLRFRATL